MAATVPYQIFPLGDQALTIDFGNRIDPLIHTEVMARYHDWKANPIPGTLELVPAYSSVTIYYQLPAGVKIPPAQTLFEWMKANVEISMKRSVHWSDTGKQLHRIPVCYDPLLVPELIRHAEHCRLQTETLISLHTERIYTVYMLGFLPGFPYMGEVNEKIALPRKPAPVPVPAGAVGIAGKQTGIYPLRSQGGWCLIGITPLQLFDTSKEMPALFQPGDQVQFYSISLPEYRAMKEGAGK